MPYAAFHLVAGAVIHVLAIQQFLRLPRGGSPGVECPDRGFSPDKVLSKFLVEDELTNSLSYTSFLCQLHRQIMS